MHLREVHVEKVERLCSGHSRPRRLLSPSPPGVPCLWEGSDGGPTLRGFLLGKIDPGCKRQVEFDVSLKFQPNLHPYSCLPKHGFKIKHSFYQSH